MKRLVPVLALAALSLAACSREGAQAPTSPSAASDAGPGETSSNAAASADAQADATATPASSQAPTLAMAYSLGLVIPGEQVRPLMESHEEACERAGSAQCQVLVASASAEGKDKATAQLTLRATPAWMRLFRTRAEADAKDLGGKVGAASTEGDDLSKSMVDTEAAQQARAAERARLIELMRRQTKNLDQTLQVEQEITRVQTEMDQADSELASMQGRIAMQTLTVSYQSSAMAAPEGIAAPLAEAGKSFLGNVIAVLAGLITAASFLLPPAGVGALIWALVRRRRPRPTLPAAAVTPGEAP